jgi:hypothetical protein
MIPFCDIGQYVCVGCVDEVKTYGIVEVLDLAHQLDHGLVTAVSNERCLGNTQTVLSTDTAVALSDPLVHEGFELLLNSFVVAADRHVKVEVGIAHVAIAYNIDDRELILSRVSSTREYISLMGIDKSYL